MHPGEIAEQSPDKIAYINRLKKQLEDEAQHKKVKVFSILNMVTASLMNEPALPGSQEEKNGILYDCMHACAWLILARLTSKIFSSA